MADPFEEFDEAAKQYEQQTRQTLDAGKTPTAEEKREEAIRRAVQASAAEDFTNLPTLRRGIAGARHVVGSMPLINHIPGISGFARPEAGTEAAQDLELYRGGMPTSTKIGEMLGESLPFAGVAGLAPKAMSTVLRAMGMGGAVGAGEDYLDGGNPLLGGIAGAASMLPMGVAGRAITPRSMASSTAARDAHQAGIDSAFGNFRGTVEAAVRGARPTPTAMSEASRALQSARRPPMSIPELGDRSIDRLTRQIHNTTQQAMFGILGAGLGHHQGVSPWLTGAAGMFAPQAGRLLVNAGNRAIGALNRKLDSEGGRSINTARRLYLNNQLLSDETRAMLHALGASPSQELLPAPRIPTLSEE